MFKYFRLSTIRNSDKIIAIKDGIVEEEGSHESLMEKKSLYYNLVLAQTNSQEENNLDENIVEDVKTLDLPTTVYGSINNNLTTTLSIDPKEDHPPVDFFRVMKMNMVEWPYISMGILASIIMGGGMPVYAILFGEVLGVLKLAPDQAREDSVYYCGLFVACGVTIGQIKCHILRSTISKLSIMS